MGVGLGWAGLEGALAALMPSASLPLCCSSWGSRGVMSNSCGSAGGSHYAGLWPTAHIIPDLVTMVLRSHGVSQAGP